MRAPN